MRRARNGILFYVPLGLFPALRAVSVLALHHRQVRVIVTRMISRRSPRFLPLAAWVVAVLCFQDVLDDSFSDAKMPDLALLLVVFLAIRYDTSHSLVVGFILGILRDVWTLSYFGTNSVVLVLAGYFPHAARKNLNMSSLYTQWVIVLLATVGAWMVKILIYWGLGKTFTPAWEAVLRQVLFHSLLFWPLRWFWNRTLYPFRPPEGKPLFIR